MLYLATVSSSIGASVLLVPHIAMHRILLRPRRVTALSFGLCRTSLRRRGSAASRALAHHPFGDAVQCAPTAASRMTSTALAVGRWGILGARGRRSAEDEF